MASTITFDAFPPGDPVLSISVNADGSDVVTSPTTDFVQSGIEDLDVLEVLEGSDAGLYIILDVSIESLTLHKPLSANGSVDVHIRKKVATTANPTLRLVFEE